MPDDQTKRAFRLGEERLQGIAGALDDALPEPLLFTLVIYTPGEGGYASYVSNGHREDMIKALRECADTLEAKAESEPGTNLERH